MPKVIHNMLNFIYECKNKMFTTTHFINDRLTKIKESHIRQIINHLDKLQLYKIFESAYNNCAGISDEFILESATFAISFNKIIRNSVLTQDYTNDITNIITVLEGIKCIRENFKKILDEDVTKKLIKLEEENAQMMLDYIIKEDNPNKLYISLILDKIGISQTYNAKALSFIGNNKKAKIIITAYPTLKDEFDNALARYPNVISVLTE